MTLLQTIKMDLEWLNIPNMEENGSLIDSISGSKCSESSRLDIYTAEKNYTLCGAGKIRK